MLALGLDSSTNVAGVAVINDDNVLAEFFLNTGKTHSQRLLPLLSEMMNFSDLKLQDLDVFAVTSGPGSFTGLRIGMTTMKTLAQVTGKPLVGVPTLDALAMNLTNKAGLVCPILNARKNEVYTAVYRWESNSYLNRLTDYMAVSPAELIDKLKKFKDEKIIFLGDGVSVYKEYISERLGFRASWAVSTHLLPRASQAAYLGMNLFKQGMAVDNLHDFQPLYIRPSEAEVRLAERQRRDGSC